MDVNQIGSWLPIVTDNIAHQDIEHIVIDRNSLFEARHGEQVEVLNFHYPDKRTTRASLTGRRQAADSGMRLSRDIRFEGNESLFLVGRNH